MVTQVRLLSISRSSEVCLLEWVWPWLANVREGWGRILDQWNGFKTVLVAACCLCYSKNQAFSEFTGTSISIFSFWFLSRKCCRRDLQRLYRSLPLSIFLEGKLSSMETLTFHVCWHDFFWVCFSFASFWGFLSLNHLSNHLSGQWLHKSVQDSGKYCNNSELSKYNWKELEVILEPWSQTSPTWWWTQVSKILRVCFW